MAMKLKHDGIPRSTIHMGASAFTLTSSLNGQVSRVNLNDRAKIKLGTVAHFLCDLHGIASKDAPKSRANAQRRAPGTMKRTKAPKPIGNLPLLQAAM